MDMVLASNNRGKIKEFTYALSSTPWHLISQSDLGVTEVDETGGTFVENALIKARHAAEITGKAAMADDSGLVVDHLKGMPGIYSARYAKGTDQDRNNKLLAALEGVPWSQRTARFYCVIVMMRHASDPMPMIATGQLPGFISIAPTGQQGFGYDPVFYVPEMEDRKSVV